ncbi:MAG: hypothetical protein V4447_10765 [Pseudomonadota bacterium]
MRAYDFVESTTILIGGTGGNGAVTLSAISGTPGLVQAIGAVSTQLVRYVIRDESTTSAKKFESGIGTLSGTTLTRTRPQISWDGSTNTLKDGSGGVAATPIAFGSTPTAGNVIISLSAMAEDKFPALVGAQTTVGSSAFRDYLISQHVNTLNSGGGAALVANTQYYCYSMVTIAGLLTGIQLNVTAAVAASHIRLGLYDYGNDGLPKNLLCTFNIVDSSTTGLKADTTISTWNPSNSLWLNPDWYPIGVLSDNTPSILCAGGFQMAPRSPLSDTNAYGPGFSISVPQAYSSGLQPTFSGTPSAINNGGANNINCPWLGLKISS